MQILFVGAHSDDIEIGCWSLVRKCVLSDYDVRFLILSDEDSMAHFTRRRSEARRSVRRFGMPDDSVEFLGMADGFINCDRTSVSACRSRCANMSPDVVVVHSNRDGHQDHRAANAIVRSTFRKRVILSYSVFCSGESLFQPSILNYLTKIDEIEKKAHLCTFESQLFRLNLEDLESWEMKVGEGAGRRAEGFEVMLQAGSSVNTLERFIADLDLVYRRQRI